jgi:hypothetical protein
MGVIWVVILGIVVWTVVSVRRERVTDLTWLNQTLPETITLDAKGATWRVSGEQVTLRWADVKGWRERDRVVSLDGPAGPVIMIPMANLSESERHALRNLLRAVVPRARH